jgi:hypothetical protein
LPDEIHPLYEPEIFNPKRIGKTYWYVLEGRRRPTDESLVRISFDLTGKVIYLDHWGGAFSSESEQPNGKGTERGDKSNYLSFVASEIGLFPFSPTTPPAGM